MGQIAQQAIIRGIPTTVLILPNVLKAAKDHFGC